MKYQFNFAFDDRLIEKLGYEPKGQVILVIRAVMDAIRLAENNRVIFVTDDLEAKTLFESTVIGNGEFGCDDECIFIETPEINKKTDMSMWLEWSKEIDMKFDVAIMNPPYDRNLHLKILEQIIPHTNKVVNISPVRWLLDPFAPYSSRSDYCKFENSISKKIESLDMIPAKKASELFDAAFTMNLGIYVCGNGGYEYQHNDPLITKIVEKTMNNSWKAFSWQDFYAGNIPVKNYKLNVAPIHSKDSKYPIMCQTYEKQIKVLPAKKRSDGNGGMGQNGGHFEFDSDAERKNFYECYNHPFMIWWVKHWKEDVHVMGYKIPYFSDYSHPWDYKDFFKWFDLTKEEQERVHREINEMQAE